MSVFLIRISNGKKIMLPVANREEYLRLRNSEENRRASKHNMVQMNYSCLPNDDGTLKGATRMSTTVGMDIDEPVDKDFVLSKKDELGLLMFENSATKENCGHIVFRRKPELSQEENLRWAADLLGIEYDKGAKDITRVFYTPADKLLFLDDEIFEVGEGPSKSPCLGGLSDHSEGLKAINQTTKQLNDQTTKQLNNSTLPYSKIIPAFFQMECQSYPEVPEGTRNDTLFNVTAKYLRYCTDHSFARIKALLFPDYAFGLGETEMDSIIRSALSRERSYTPKAVKHVLRKYGKNNDNDNGNDNDDDNGNDKGKPYRDLDMCIIDEVQLPQMPRWVNVMLKVAPPGYRFITLAATAPAMMALLTDVNVKFGKKRQTRLNGWTHVDGPPASNKSICLSPIPVLMKPLQDIDDHNLERENDYFLKKEECVNKKEQPKMPKDIVIRILPPNTTRLEHIKRMADAKGKHTYTYCEEIQSLNMTAGSQYHNRSDFMQLMFDNGMTGNHSFTSNSLRVRCPVCWNISTSGTRDQTIRTFKNATNGAVTRVFFCLVPDNSGAPMPEYVQYTDEDKAYIARAGEIMMQMNGVVLSPKIDKALNEWVEKMRRESLGDTERLILKNRSADIAHHFAVTIHLAWIVQHIMDTEDREGRKIEVRDLDLNQYNERQSVVDMAVYAADQCLDSQYRLWAKKMKQQLEVAYEGTAVYKKSDEEFSFFPDEFTYSSLDGIFPGKKPATIRKMVERLKAAGKVVVGGTHPDTGEKLFKKIK